MVPDTGLLVAEILNAAYMVRHHRRGSRLFVEAEHRREAIAQLGLILKKALNQSDDYEPILAAVVDGLRPNDTPSF